MSPPVPSTPDSVRAEPRPPVVVFDLGPGELPGALLRVCGLPVLLRNLLLCQRRGVSRVVLACTPEGRAQVDGALAGRSLELSLSYGSSPDDITLPARADVLHWPGSLSFGRFFPATLLAAPGQAFGLPLPAGSQALVRAPAATWREASPGSWSERAQILRGRGLPRLELPSSEAGALRQVHDAASARAAEASLLRSLRKNADGAVAKYDRYVSLAISRFLMKFPITPNQVTCAAALLGVLCGLLVAGGGYTRMLLGALAFQLNSIFDGIDGEIARAKLLESRFGQWLDTVADDFSNFAFVVGVGVGCARTHHWAGYWMLGLIAGLGQLCSSAVQYHYIITVARSGDLNDFKPPWDAHAPSERPAQGAAPRGWVSKIEWVFRRDAFVAMSTVFALMGQLRVLTWAFAIGANLVWSSVVGYRLLKGIDAAGRPRSGAQRRLA